MKNRRAFPGGARWHIFIGVVVLGLLIVCGILPSLRAGFVAHPLRKALPDSEVIPFAYENLAFSTPEHLQVHGWYAISQNRAVVILLHGYKGNRADYLEPAQVLVENGYGVLLLDLLAHGESEGRVLTLNGAEVLAALDYLQTRSDVDANRIGVWGFSLGGLVAIQAAAQEPAVQAVIADGPFPVVAAQDMPIPVTLEDWLWVPFDRVQWQLLKFYGVSPAMPTTEALKHIAPRSLLLIAGIENRGEQRVLQKYYREAGEGAELWEVAGANHVESWMMSRSLYESKMLIFFKQTLLDTKSPSR